MGRNDICHFEEYGGEKSWLFLLFGCEGETDDAVEVADQFLYVINGMSVAFDVGLGGDAGSM